MIADPNALCSQCPEPHSSILWNGLERKKVRAYFCDDHKRAFTRMNKAKRGRLLARLDDAGTVGS